MVRRIIRTINPFGANGDRYSINRAISRQPTMMAVVGDPISESSGNSLRDQPS